MKRIFSSPFILMGLLFTALLINQTALALPFNISPEVTLPSTVPPFGSVTAYYTVQNNTTTTRNGNYVKYLPPHVTQVTNGGAGMCGARFNLNPKNSSGDSCTLALNISGAVSASDTSSHHNIFVCFPGGISCAGTSSRLNVSVPTSALMGLGAGFYNDTTTSYPMIAQSNDGGSNWTFPSDILNFHNTHLPYYSAELTASSCSESVCIGAGSYQSTMVARTRQPLVALTLNKGADWTFPPEVYGLSVSTISNYYGIAHLYGASCNGSTCVAVGDYLGTVDLSSYVLLTLSTNYGANWSFPSDIHHAGQFNAVSCSGSTCMASGYYVGLAPIPLIAISTNNGANWSFPEDITNVITEGTIPGLTYAAFRGASCSGNICIATGDGTISGRTNPFLAISQNNGAGWSFPETIYNPSFEDYGGGAQLTPASCDGQICISSGSYTKLSDDNPFPLLALTTNGGDTWTYPSDILNISIPGMVNGNLQGGASCSHNLCIASGSYGDGTQFHPLLAVSQNGGKNWFFPSEIYTVSDTTITDFVNGDFTSGGASCNGSFCTVSGSYNTGDPFSPRPLLAMSVDGGTHWTYPNQVWSVTSPTLPDFVTGSFGDASTSMFAHKSFIKKREEGLRSMLWK